MKRICAIHRWSARRLIIACSVLALGACTTTTHQPSAPSEVRIGLLGSLSGPGRGTGQDAVRGAQLAAVVVNQAQSLPIPLAARAGLPGLGGAKIRILQADTGADPDKAATAATRLVAEQHVAGLVSADSATATAVASERTERIGVPFLSSIASANFLTDRGLDWYFRVTPTDQLVAEAVLARVAQAGAGAGAVDRFGIVHASDQASNDAANAVQALATESGDQVVASAVFAPGSDPGAAVAQLRGAGAEAVIAVASQPGDARSLLTAGAVGGTQPRSLAIGGGFTQQTVQQAAGSPDTKVLHGTVWSQDFAKRNLAANALADLYQQRFHASMTEAAAETFTAVITLAQAIDSARSPDAQAIRTALLGLNVPGRDTIMPWGGVRFDQTGQNVEATGLVEEVSRDAARVVFPPELAAANT
jgi:branched-chain amino acid transport system substrate-binding protein